MKRAWLLFTPKVMIHSDSYRDRKYLQRFNTWIVWNEFSSNSYPEGAD